MTVHTKVRINPKTNNNSILLHGVSLLIRYIYDLRIAWTNRKQIHTLPDTANRNSGCILPAGGATPACFLYLLVLDIFAYMLC